jgi:ribose 5-phosphate isomerase B
MLYLACDHGGFSLKEDIKKDLTRLKIDFEDLTTEFIERDDYPNAARTLAEIIKDTPGSKGIAICTTGQGICIALNRYPWIRAGLGHKREVIRLFRAHNDGNVLCLSGKFTNTTKAIKLIKIFLGTPFSKIDKHEKRVKMLTSNLEI